LIYRHEQIGRVYIGLLGVVAVLCIAVALGTSNTSLWLAVGAFTIFVSLFFARLTLEVDRDGVRWNMTFGFPAGFVPVDEIVSVEIVPVTFWSGIGIHVTLRGWVWNVALGRGVQIHRCSGMPVVLGTDDPEALIAAIARVRSS
jgi:hypothetical protein